MSMPENTPLNKQDYNNSMRLESYDLAKFAAQLYELNGKIIWDALCDSDYKNAKRVIAAAVATPTARHGRRRKRSAR